MVSRNFSRTLKRFVRIVLDLFAALIGNIYPTKQHYLPPIRDRVILEPAVRVADKIKSGELKSEDVVKAYIDRALAVQPHINAVIQDCFSLAIAEAREVDKRVRDELDGNPPKDGVSVRSLPFLGIPFTTKDSIAVKDMYLTAGLRPRMGITATEDSDVIELMRKSGAIFIALTNVPELVMWFDSYNKIYGRTCNPYDKSRIPGGSSGGEAALLSAAGSVIGVGADIGGSIRMPSYFCGIFGHKTTPEIVSTRGMCPGASPKRQKLLSIGPMCRYACDLKPMLKVMAGDNVKKLKLDETVDITKLKVYYMESDENPLTSPVQKDISERLTAVVSHFKSIGAPTKKIYFREAKYGMNIWLSAMEDKTAPRMTQELADNKGEINLWLELFKSLFLMSNHTFCALVTCLAGYMQKASGIKSSIFAKMREELTKELHQLLGDDGILLYPTHPEIAPKHNGTLLKILNVGYTALFNPLYLAITAVPLGLSKEGLPVGLQVIAAPYNDHLTIAVAEALEKEFGGWVSPSTVEC